MGSRFVWQFIECDKSKAVYVGNRTNPKLETPLTILEVPSAKTEVPAMTSATDSVKQDQLF